MRLHAAAAAVSFLSASAVQAAPIYLNVDAGITVSVGSGSIGGFVNVSEAQSLANVIDLDAATDPDFHNQSSHVWWSGGPLELIFDFHDEYNLTSLHFWNYFTEAFDVDNIGLNFFDSLAANMGSLNVVPALGGPGTPNEMIVPQTIGLAAQNVRFVSAVLTATNSQIDFNNLGFTGELSSPGPGPDPAPGPGNGPTPVPEPSALGLLSVGLLVLVRRCVK